MTRTAKYITIEGQFANGVLGAFRIIRGFATLQDLGAISAPFPMNLTPGGGQALAGHQRAIEPAHADAIERYLQDGKPRFIPEIILSIRAEFRDELDPQAKTIGVIADTVPGETVKRRWKSRNIATHQVTVDKTRLQTIVETERRIRRIDGNHRLHLANQLLADVTLPTNYLAPFCAILLGPPGDENDDLVESMLFHTINSTALPLDSEHTLQLVLGQAAQYRPSADQASATNAPRWDLASGRIFASFVSDWPMLSCAVAPNGRTFVAGDERGRVHLLRLMEPGDADKEAEGMPQHVFLSYCRENDAVVRQLYDELTAAGHTVWRDQERLLPGMDWKHEIRRAIRGAYAVVICFSQEVAARHRSGIYPEDVVVLLEEDRDGVFRRVCPLGFTQRDELFQGADDPSTSRQRWSLGVFDSLDGRQ